MSRSSEISYPEIDSGGGGTYGTGDGGGSSTPTAPTAPTIPFIPQEEPNTTMVATTGVEPSIKDYLDMVMAGNPESAEQSIISSSGGESGSGMVYLLVIGAVGVGVYYWWSKKQNG